MKPLITDIGGVAGSCLAVFSEPLYTIETDLTAQEIAMIDEGMAEYRKNPSSFVPLENLGKR
ncbi:MAG: hypothetical protein FWG66_16110 [Spirochaetes bacterium]|nr:hypothetical protein [Spirochaetota bacterium]